MIDFFFLENTFKRAIKGRKYTNVYIRKLSGNMKAGHQHLGSNDGHFLSNLKNVMVDCVVFLKR